MHASEENIVQLIDPFPGCYDTADPFGNTYPPRIRPHTGADWNVAPGRPIPALGAGVIVGKQWHAENGNTVTVRLDDSELYYSYLHMLRPSPVLIGSRVEPGQTIGTVGATGTSARGAHLHVTVSDTPLAYRGLGVLRDPWAFINDNREENSVFIRIQSPSRGVALIAPGYVRRLVDKEEIEHSGVLVARHLRGDDHQFDLWVSMALASHD